MHLFPKIRHAGVVDNVLAFRAIKSMERCDRPSLPFDISFFDCELNSLAFQLAAP